MSTTSVAVRSTRSSFLGCAWGPTPKRCALLGSTGPEARSSRGGGAPGERAGVGPRPPSNNADSRLESARRPFTRRSVRQRVNEIVHPELVRLVRQVDRCVPRIRELPVLPEVVVHVRHRHHPAVPVVVLEHREEHRRHPAVRRRHGVRLVDFEERVDRKSTRLNSSHGYISYAVFCSKKKKPDSSTKALNKRKTSLIA